MYLERNCARVIYKIIKAGLIVSLVSTVGTFGSENEWRLKILSGYDKNIPPTTILNKDPQRGGIDLGITLRRIEDFSVSQGTLKLVGYLYIGWRDDRLQWGQDYAFIGIDREKIWKPKRRVFNSVKPFMETSNPIFVTSVGFAYLSDITTINTECTPTIERFPFDKHECQIILGVMSSKGENIETHAMVDIPMTNWARFLVENSKWAIKSFVYSREYFKPLPKHNITIPAKIATIVIQRNCPLIALVIFTVALVSGVFGLLPFWLPPLNSFVGLRLALGLVGLLTAGRTSDTIYEFAPAQQGSSPFIAKFCLICGVMTTLSLLETLLVSHLTHLTSKPQKFVESVIKSDVSNLILRFWSNVNGNVRGKGYERSLLSENNEENVLEPEVNWTTVALVIDSCGFALQVTTWIILCLISFSF